MRSLILASALLCQVLHAQVSQPQAELLPGAGGTWNVQWWGNEGRSYFLQASDDLVTWHYAPLIEAGNDEIIQYEAGSLGSRHFVRLAYTDQTASNLDTADFDGDKLGNLAEINVHHTDPLKKDSDVDGMPDGWEITHGLDPNDNGSVNVVNGPNGDGDGDGIPNLQEFQGGTDPVNPGSFPPSLIYVEKTANQYFPGSGTGSLSKFASWLPNDSSTDSISGFLTPQAMVGVVESAYAFPPLPPQKAITSPVGGTVGVVGATYNSVDSGGGTTVHGYVQHGRFWLKATPGDIAKGRGSQKYLKVIDRYTGPYSGPLQTLDPLISIEKLEAKAGTGGYSDPLDIKPEVVTANGDFASTTIIRLIPVNIEPVEGMAGVVGDMVPSNRTESPELHFVTPRKTAEIAEDYVTFTATGITEQQIDGSNNNPAQILEWDGGQPVLNEPLKRRVKRDVSAKTVVRIRTLPAYGGDEVAKMNVWVVWAIVNGDPQANAMLIDKPRPQGMGTFTAVDWKFRATVFPFSLFQTADDIPDLREAPISDTPETKIDRHALDNGPYIRPLSKWDLSRQWRARSLTGDLSSADCGLDPQCKIAADYPVGAAGKIHKTTPNEGSDHYPVDPLEGNDGSVFPQNPYLGGLELGVLVDEDGPRDFVKTSAGNLNDVFETRNHFAEFARVEINGKWFAISEDYEWKYHVRLKKKSESIENIDYNNDGDKIDVVWTDFQTVTDNTNEGF